ncbi:hypothetical protein LTS18_003521 [Coniosporium uncinatum]|uniref:Uncharacterized protein n=1 Tax=Coniosporium uncinatum TaxID=93489 RepID=A0ACC3DYT9_9PEZI|nr:hypothetical protein LTS18_003521 [Coniosporium uncinatum]
MDMGTSSMDMGGMSMTSSIMNVASATASSAMAAASTGMAMGGMDHAAMDMGTGDCKISMLWNWYTIDTCFLSRTWHVRSTGAFAGSCIGVICLVVVLEFLRRLAKEYDRLLMRNWQRSIIVPPPTTQRAVCNPNSSDDDSSTRKPGASAVAAPVFAASEQLRFRPTVLQQAVRALLHMLQFAVAYFVMLLAMYYNG